MNLFDLPLPQRLVPAPAAKCVRCGSPYDANGTCLRRAEGCQGGRGEWVAPTTTVSQLSVALQPAPALAAPKATVGLRRVSHSELVSFLTCNRLHYYQYRLRREPKTTAEPLLVGRRVENIIKQLWLGQTPDLSELPPEERALCKAYPIWWQYHTLCVKRVDIPFQVEIAGVQYVGEFDGDGEDKGEEIIVELKTTSDDISLGAPYWRRIAQVDPQVTTYLMAARAQGRPLRRVVYDVIRKVTMERAMATPLDKRKYTKVTKSEPISRLYANMRETDETDDEYELRILEDIEKQPDRYFQRQDIVRYEDEHQAHMRDVAGNVRLMQLVETMPEAPRNVGSCFKWGRSCSYLPVCLGEDRIDNNFLYQDRVREKWGLWCTPLDTSIAPFWMERSEGNENTGKIRDFASREDAERWGTERGSRIVPASTWESRKLPGREKK